MPYEVHVIEVEAGALAVSRFRAAAAEMGQKLGDAFGLVEAYLSEAGRSIEGPAIAYYVQAGEGRFEVRAGFGIAVQVERGGGVEPFELPAGLVATTTHVGPYETLPEAYAALMDGAKAQGYELEPASPMWEAYHSPPDTPPEQTVTVVYWPVKARSGG